MQESENKARLDRKATSLTQDRVNAKGFVSWTEASTRQNVKEW